MCMVGGSGPVCTAGESGPVCMVGGSGLVRTAGSPGKVSMYVFSLNFAVISLTYHFGES